MVELFLRDALRCSDAQKKMLLLQGTRTSTTFGTRSSKSFAIWLQIPHFSSLRTFRQVLNLGLLTQSHKIGLEGIFFGQCAAASTASTPNPTWIEEKRPKSGFSTSIILRHYHWKILKLSILLRKKPSIKKCLHYWKGPLLEIDYGVIGIEKVDIYRRVFFNVSWKLKMSQ